MKRIRSFIYSVLALVALAFFAWMQGLVWFVNNIPREPLDAASHTDAIVVLTGGSVRLNGAVRLLVEGKAEKLFITGIGKGADLESLLILSGPLPEGVEAVLDRIELGYEAENTEGNARETAAWMNANHFHSLRLVTAHYHMPRSLVLFHQLMPETEIIMHPVAPENVMLEAWWNYRGTKWLLASEFNKYLALTFSHYFTRAS